MSHQIQSVAVIGAGTMGAGIAAHVANAGIPALLLDIVPNKLTETEEKKGLTLDSPVVRNRIVNAGLDRAKKARPASFMSKDAERLVTVGNVEDDFDKIAEADWIVEVIIEQVAPKQAMMERIEAVRKPGSIATSNSSGLPMATIAEGRSDDFKKHFCGTHFFNPPRYLKLLEVIATEDTDPEVLKTISAFGEEVLGKGVVYCKDTPNFIGNRLFSIGNSYAVNYALENGYNVSEVDALTGPLIGRPKTATIRLLDLVGVDIGAFVAHNLHDLIPHDPYRDVLHSQKLDALFEEMLGRKWLGNKTGQGFYKKGKDADGKRIFMTLNLDTFEYEVADKVRFESVGAVRKTEDLGKRVSALLDDQWAEDRGAQYVRNLLCYELSYAAYVAPEIAHNLTSVDDAMRWGFAWEAGPFQLWDLLGVAEMVAKIEAAGHEVAAWVKEMLAAGCETFYQTENGQVSGYYDWDKKGYVAVEHNPKHLTLTGLRSCGSELAHNDSASLHDMGDGVLLFEYHAKMNALDDGIVEMIGQAHEMLKEDRFVGMVVGNDGQNFSVGANIFMIGMAAQQKMFDDIDEWLKKVQDGFLAFHYSQKPVVAAVHQRALGGGAEAAFGSSRIVAHAESYIGLVEAGVGVIPAGGGVTTLIRRIISEGMKLQHADPLPLAQKVFENIGMGKVSTSAAEARELGYLQPTDRIVMNRDHLLYEAKQEVLSMVAEGYAPPTPARMYAGGRDLKAAMMMGVWMMQQGNYISEHDKLIGNKLADIISGGDLSGEQWLTDQHFLDLERKAFLELTATEQTQARIWYMLENGKPLRN